MIANIIISDRDLQALIQILQRCPLSAAEALYIEQLIEKLHSMIDASKMEPQKISDPIPLEEKSIEAPNVKSIKPDPLIGY